MQVCAEERDSGDKASQAGRGLVIQGFYPQCNRKSRMSIYFIV